MRPAPRPRLPGLAFAFTVALAAFAGACGKEIGDECKVNVDCSINGDRLCDTAQPGGYCTVEGCDERSCPGDSVCVRFFSTQYLDRTCDPRTEGEPEFMCRAEELCVPDGHCALRSSERRYCAKTCGDSGDCRDGYECRRFGDRGAFKLPTQNGGADRFCSPRP